MPSQKGRSPATGHRRRHTGRKPYQGSSIEPRNARSQFGNSQAVDPAALTTDTAVSSNATFTRADRRKCPIESPPSTSAAFGSVDLHSDRDARSQSSPPSLITDADTIATRSSIVTDMHGASDALVLSDQHLAPEHSNFPSNLESNHSRPRLNSVTLALNSLESQADRPHNRSFGLERFLGAADDAWTPLSATRTRGSFNYIDDDVVLPVTNEFLGLQDALNPTDADNFALNSWLNGKDDPWTPLNARHGRSRLVKT